MVHLQVGTVRHVCSAKQWIYCSPCHPWYGCCADNGHAPAYFAKHMRGLYLSAQGLGSSRGEGTRRLRKPS